MRLREHIESTAESLRGLGVRPEDRVALVLPNGPDLATAFLSVASCAGAAPLNPAYRKEEIEFHLASVKARAIIVQRGGSGAAREAARTRGVRILELTPSAEAGVFSLRGEPVGVPGPRRDPSLEDVALLLHTSGTTARPKLVPITHANLRAGTENFHRMTGIGPDDRCLSFHPLFHVGGLLSNVFVSLAAGGSVACLPALDPTRFFARLAEFDPTWCGAVPAMLQAIVATNESNSGRTRRGRLRWLRVGASPCPPALQERAETVIGAFVRPAYNMTESTLMVACAAIPPAPRKRGSVGRPGGTTEVAIMDSGGTLLQAGETGEIVLHGPSVVKGYEDNPEADRESHTGAWFRTGDQGFMDPDGFLFLSGRLKELINRGGEKISPREVEEVLLAHPAVSGAVVFPVPHRSLGQGVGAAVTLRGGAPPNEGDLRKFVASRLATFKVPWRIAFFAELPAGPGGKVQRLKLAETLGWVESPAAAGKRRLHEDPESPLERRLAEIWRAVLRIPYVGITDDFFDLGGDSLSAARLVAAIHSKMGVDYPLSDVAASSTLRSQALAILLLQAAQLQEGEWEGMMKDLEEAPSGSGNPGGPADKTC